MKRYDVKGAPRPLWLSEEQAKAIGATEHEPAPEESPSVPTEHGAEPDEAAL